MIDLYNQIKNCNNCPLYKEMPCGPVPFYGNSKIMIIAECPGIDEAYAGEPLVGRCGKFFQKQILDVVGLKRTDLYITNTVKCCSRYNNKNIPLRKDTIEICSNWLVKEIYELQPKVIVTMGKVATYSLLKDQIKKSFKLENIVGQKFIYNKSIVIPCEHPSHLMLFGKQKIKKIIDIFLNIKKEYL